MSHVGKTGLCGRPTHYVENGCNKIPMVFAVDNARDVYEADSGNQAIRKSRLQSAIQSDTQLIF
jgi:hypothetical protein